MLNDITLSQNYQKTCPNDANFLQPCAQRQPILLSALIVRGEVIRGLINNKLFCPLIADESANTPDTQLISVSVRDVSSERDNNNAELIYTIFLGSTSLEHLRTVGVTDKCTLL